MTGRSRPRSRRHSSHYRKPARDRGLSDLPPVIDELVGYLRGEPLRSDAHRDAFARGRKIEPAVLCANGRAVISHRGRLVGDPGLIEVVSYRVDDPLAVLLLAERIAADRRLRGDRSIAVLDEQIQIELSVVQTIERYD